MVKSNRHKLIFLVKGRCKAIITNFSTATLLSFLIFSAPLRKDDGERRPVQKVSYLVLLKYILKKDITYYSL
jgi:hypothetical protein